MSSALWSTAAISLERFNPHTIHVPLSPSLFGNPERLQTPGLFLEAFSPVSAPLGNKTDLFLQAKRGPAKCRFVCLKLELQRKKLKRKQGFEFPGRL